METYATVILFAIPLFLLLILIEWAVASRRKARVMRSVDTLSSLSSGLTNIVKDVLGLSIAIVSYDWLVGNIALFEIETTWLAIVVTFLVKDFGGYWNHRFNHEINFLWNRHIIHHSSEEYNLACALRQSISEIFSYFAIFLIPIALIGVPTDVIAIVAPLHLFAQFWYHTRLIDKMGWLEHFMVTPSHHRVHHAINDEYIDKNYSEVFIVWDKLFGTFQPELPDVPPVFGIKKAAQTWNPFLINFQHLWSLYRDAWNTKSWYDKLRIWFMPTGWRPADVAAARPYTGVLSGEAVFRQNKYETNPSTLLLGYCWVQFGIVMLFIIHLFLNIAAIGVPGIFAYGLYLFLIIFSFTSLLDFSKLSLGAEALKLLTLAVNLYVYTGWFGLDELLPYGSVVVLIHALVSTALTAFLLFTPTVSKRAVA